MKKRHFLLIEPNLLMVDGWYLDEDFALDALHRHNSMPDESWAMLELVGGDIFYLVEGTTLGNRWHTSVRSALENLGRKP